MDKLKNIIFFILGIAITILLLWFFIAFILPVLIIAGLIFIIYIAVRNTSFIKKIKKELKGKQKRKKKDKIQEAEIIEEK